MARIKQPILFVMLIGGLALAFDAFAQIEVQQQLEGVSSTLDNVSTQLESVKEKGIVQTVWDNLMAPVKSVWDQIMVILGQISAILGVAAK